MKGPIFTTTALLALAGAVSCDHTSNVAGPGAVRAELVAPAAGSLREPVYYEGRVLFAQLAAATSSDPNQLQFLCYNFGHDFNPSDQNELASPVYVIIAPGATQHAGCPDGSAPTHDHVVGLIPGDAGYTGFYRITAVVALPSFNTSRMPITSVAAMRAAVDAGEMVVLAPLFVIHAPIVGVN